MADPEVCALGGEEITKDNAAELWLSIGIVNQPQNKVHRVWGGGRVMGRHALCVDCAFKLDTVAAEAVRLMLESSKETLQQ